MQTIILTSNTGKTRYADSIEPLTKQQIDGNGMYQNNSSHPGCSADKSMDLTF